MDKVEIKGQYTWLDYTGASEGAFKAKRWTRRLYLLSSILFYVLSINTLSSLGKENGRIILWAYAIILIVLLWMPHINRLIPNNHKKEWLEDKRWNVEFETIFSPEKILSKNEFSSNVYFWSHFIRWREDEERIFFFHSYANYWFLPKRLFTPDELSFVKKLLSENGIKKFPGPSLLPQAITFFIGSVLLLMLRLFAN